jgi:hypothetical protein
VWNLDDLEPSRLRDLRERFGSVAHDIVCTRQILANGRVEGARQIIFVNKLDARMVAPRTGEMDVIRRSRLKFRRPLALKRQLSRGSRA